MTKYYDSDQAVNYLGDRGFKTTKGTLAVWRCRKTGPEYRKLRGRALYFSEGLDAFLAGGITVKTVDSVGAR